MNQEYVIGQLRTGDKTVREITEQYLQDHPGKSMYSARQEAQHRLTALKRQGIVEAVGKVRVTVETHNAIRGKVHYTHSLKVWRLIHEN